MAYLLLVRGTDLQGRQDEYVVIADTDDEGEFEEYVVRGYELVEKISIFDDVGRWPTDRNLRYGR